MIYPLALLIAFASGQWLCAAPPQAEKDDFDQSRSELRPPIERYSADRMTLIHAYPVDFSPARQARMRVFYNDWLQRLAKLNFDSLSEEGRIDFLLFRNQLNHEVRQLDTQAKRIASESPLLPFAASILELEDAQRRIVPVDSPKVALKLTELARQIDQAKRSAEAALPNGVKKTLAYQAAARAQILRTTLGRWFQYYNGYDPLFTWWAAEPFKTADAALQTYIAFLRERVAGVPAQAAQARAGDSADIIGNPIGRDGLMSELAHEMIPYTPEELIAIANKEFAWCEDQMKRAAHDLGYDDWHKALEYVKTLYVEPGKQPALIRDQAREAIAFMDEFNLITIPQLARESWRMEMMTPERQLVNPFFTGGDVISVSYPTNTMSAEQKMMSMRGNNIHFSRATVFHELIPGHELQTFMAARYRTHRELFDTPFLLEGWSLYWELLLWDMNFAKSPENRIGMLFWRMHRCARIIFSLSFHLEKMTPKECIDFLVDRVGHERENAIGEVRRSFSGDYSPLYQAAYLLGGMQLHALHKELVAPGKMTNRAFHDAVLKENSIPIEMIRASLTHQKLTRDFVTSWKFYRPVKEAN